MKKTILGVALGVSLASGVAMADIAGDINVGLSMNQVFANALSEGFSLKTAVQQALTTAPQQAGAIIAAAVAAQPANAQAVVIAAIAACVHPGQAVAAAISGGADPSSVSGSPHLGGPPCINTTVNTTVAGTSGEPISLPTSTNGAGSGGGGGGVSTN